MLLLQTSADFIQNKLFPKNSFTNIRVSNGLDQDQDRQSMLRPEHGPDLGPNCLLSLPTDDKSGPYIAGGGKEFD